MLSRQRPGRKDYTCNQTQLDLFSLLWLGRVYTGGTVGDDSERCAVRKQVRDDVSRKFLPGKQDN